MTTLDDIYRERGRPEARAFYESIREEARREQWRATRAPFQRVAFSGSLSLSAGTVVSANLVSDPTQSTDTEQTLQRVRRVQLKLMVPKNGADVVSGWFAFTRDTQLAGPAGVLGFAEPRVLRPSQFLSNPDHATYWDAYLPAVNLVSQPLRVVAWGSQTYTVHYIGRAVIERAV